MPIIITSKEQKNQRNQQLAIFFRTICNKLTSFVSQEKIIESAMQNNEKCYN